MRFVKTDEIYCPQISSFPLGLLYNKNYVLIEKILSRLISIPEVCDHWEFFPF